MTPRTTDKEHKRELILRAALNVIARQGVGNFKMIDIAEKAHIGKGTLYEYFRSKDELTAGVFNLVMGDFEIAVADQLKEIQGPEDKITAIVAASCRYFAEQRQTLSVLFDLWASSIPRRRGKQLVPDMARFYAEFGGWLTGIIDEGINQGVFRQVNATLVASIIIAALDGIMFQAALGMIKLEAPEIAENISRTLLRGMLA